MKKQSPHIRSHFLIINPHFSILIFDPKTVIFHPKIENFKKKLTKYILTQPSNFVFVLFILIYD